jgi:deferrochelatase/peroxidase EfeB
MSTIDVSDVQGFALKGYNFPYARYLLLELLHYDTARRFIGAILPNITTGERWDEKPLTTLNIAFTHKGLVQLQLPMATLLSFPVEFQQGMKARGDILYDTGLNGPDRWDAVWQNDQVHVWLAVNAQTPEALSIACAELDRLMHETSGARLLQSQPASAVFIDGKPTPKEHFGYTDGFGNPDFDGAERHSQPGQGKLTKDGEWVPLATGEFVL